MTNNQVDETQPENNPEEPQIFNVMRTAKSVVQGEHYNRRNFIEKAVVASAATGVVAAGCSFMAKPVDMHATVEAAVAATNTNNKAAAANTEVPPATEAPADTSEPTEAPTDTSVPQTETPAPSPTVVGINTTVNGDNVNFRAGPGTGFPPIDRLPSGTGILLVSRLADNSWVGVSLRDPKKKDRVILGWIKTNLVTTKGLDLKSLPVIVDIPPTPTPLPGKYGHTAVGTTGIDYEYTDEYGNTYPYTVACNSPIPAGATCTCNCITVKHTCTCDNFSDHYWYPN